MHPYREPSQRLTHAPRRLAPLQAGDLVRVREDDERDGVSYAGRFGVVVMICEGVYLVRFRGGSRFYFRRALTKA